MSVNKKSQERKTPATDSKSPQARRRDAKEVGLSFDIENWLPHQCSWIANEVSRYLYSHYHARWRLSVVEWRIIALLPNRAPLSAKDIGVLTGMDAVAVTRAVGKVLRRDLVYRHVDPADRRRMALELTAAGRRVYKEMLPHLRGAEGALLAGFSAREIKLLATMLRRVRHNGERVFEGSAETAHAREKIAKRGKNAAVESSGAREKRGVQ